MSTLRNNAETTLVVGVILLCTILWIRWRRKKLRVFEELQIPGPPPHFLFGNLLEINTKGLLQCQREWIKEYGPIVGYYHGLKPVLMVTDQSMLKRIFIKDFHLFSERPCSDRMEKINYLLELGMSFKNIFHVVFGRFEKENTKDKFYCQMFSTEDVVPLRVHSILDHIIPATKIMDSLLLNQKGEQWKRVRSKLSPIFSANKLKMMIPFVDKVSEITISVLRKKAYSAEICDIYTLMQYLTLDVICAQAFALHTNVQEEGDKNLLFRSAKTIFDNPINSKVLVFGMCFPELSILGMAMNFLKMFFANGFSIPPLKITNLVGKEIEKRRNYPEMRRPDLLQSLIDASESEATNSDDTRSPISTQAKEKLTDLEVKSNALVVFLAGYETTSSALAYTLHMLARYPEYQAKIQREIDRLLQDKDLDYNILSNLQQLERFMMETMRFYPPGANFVLRIALENVDFGHVHIPKGMLITVPVSYMHFSEDNWEDPDVFDPDRFLIEKRTPNHATSYWVFGIGPRNCLGTRLANISSKVILTKLLQKFTFELPENTEDATVHLKMKCGTMVPDKVIVKIKERTNRLERKTEKM